MTTPTPQPTYAGYTRDYIVMRLNSPSTPARLIVVWRMVLAYWDAYHAGKVK